MIPAAPIPVAPVANTSNPFNKKIIGGCVLLVVLLALYYFFVYRKKNEKKEKENFSSLNSNKITVDDISDDDSDCSRC